MITVRTIGYHENAPKITNIGSRKANVERPSLLTHENGRRRAFGRDQFAAAGWRIGTSCVFSTVATTGSIVAIALPETGEPGGFGLARFEPGEADLPSFGPTFPA
jgi:hypothetical protein